MQPVLRVLSLGWGVQSWTLAAMAALGEIPWVDYAIHADTTHEVSGTYAHAEKWTPWLEEHGVKVVTVYGRRADVVREDWSNSVMIPAFTTDLETGSRGKVKRQCTDDWKIAPIRKFLRTVIGKTRPGAVEMVMGISFDEWVRMRTSNVAYITNSYPLVNHRITRAGCISWLNSHHLEIPVKSGCVFCPYHGIAAWQRLKRAGGSNWETAVEVDAAIRDKRPKYQLFVHPARVPLPQAIDIPEDHGARQMSLEDVPCDGGVCFV